MVPWQQLALLALITKDVPKFKSDCKISRTKFTNPKNAVETTLLNDVMSTWSAGKYRTNSDLLQDANFFN